MKKEMLINVLQPEECRIAILEDGVLEELYVERTSHESYVGNIYKGRIVNLEPSIQAAFVDFGVGRNGFLHISDVEPQYFRQGGIDPDKPGAFGGRPEIFRLANAPADYRPFAGRRGSQSRGREDCAQSYTRGPGPRNPTFVGAHSAISAKCVAPAALRRVRAPARIEAYPGRARRL